MNIFTLIVSIIGLLAGIIWFMILLITDRNDMSNNPLFGLALGLTLCGLFGIYSYLYLV